MSYWTLKLNSILICYFILYAINDWLENIFDNTVKFGCIGSVSFASLEFTVFALETTNREPNGLTLFREYSLKINLFLALILHHSY